MRVVTIGHEAPVPPILKEAQGEQQHEDITVPPRHDTPSPGSKVIEALEDKDESSPTHDDADEL